MTLQNSSVQTPCADLNAAPILLFIAPLASALKESFSLAKKYCLDRSLIEIIVEACVAALAVAVIYFGHAFLLSLAALWCLAMVSVAVFRFVTQDTPDNPEGETALCDEDAEAANAYMAELSESLT